MREITKTVTQSLGMLFLTCPGQIFVKKYFDLREITENGHPILWCTNPNKPLKYLQKRVVCYSLID